MHSENTEVNYKNHPQQGIPKNEVPDQTERPTLMQALERLGMVTERLDRLHHVSETLTQKLDRTYGDIKEKEIDLFNYVDSESSLVELFNAVALKMESQINEIGQNIEIAIDVIE
ncbi:MAG: hypothetical protein ACI8Q1_000270 [Parvicella sp.]|jgi:hypothetical protein